MEARRVVITGIGVISALGRNAAECWRALSEGRPGIAPIEAVDRSQLRFQNGAEVRGYVPEDYFDPKEAGFMDRFAQFALIAAKEAVADAGVEWSGDLRERSAVVTGSCVGGQSTQDVGFVDLYRLGRNRVNPMTIPRTMANAGASIISMNFGLTGPAFTLSTACSSSNHAIGQAYWMVRHGLADLAVTGGSEAPFSMGLLKAWEALRVVSPETCRPFSKDRRGMILGEGGAMLVLEPLEAARARGARVYAEIVGFGMSSDAHHLTQPSTEGPARAMRSALADAGVEPEQVGYINAHGTGTPANDPTETRAIRSVFGASCGAAGDQFHQVHARARARRGGRDGGGRDRAGAPRRDSASHGELHRARSGVRSRRDSEHRPAGERRVRSFELLRFRRTERGARLPALGRCVKRLALWVPTGTMLLVSLISYIDRNTLALLAPTILKETGLSAQQYGFVISAFATAYMLANPLWGRWLDRFGVRLGMLLAVAVWSVASASHAVAAGFLGFAVARATLGFGEGATFPGGLRTVTQTLPPSLRARGLAVAYSGGSLGAILTPLIVTPVALAWGWRAAFLFTGFLGAAWLGLWLLVSRRSDVREYRTEEAATIGGGRDAVHGCAGVELHGGLRFWRAAHRLRDLRRGAVPERGLWGVAGADRQAALDSAAGLGDRLLLLGLATGPAAEGGR